MSQRSDVVAIFAPRADVFDNEAFEDGEGLRFISGRELDAIAAGLGPLCGTRVLDVGAGTGRIARMLTDGGAGVTAVDVTPEMLDRCAARVPEATRAVTDVADGLPFDSARFDAVTCIRVLKYASDWPRVLTEIRRVVRDEGLLVVELTNRRSLARWGYRSGPVHSCTLNEFAATVQRAGFTVESVRSGVRLPFVFYRWARSPARLRWVLRAERAVEAVLASHVLARSFIVTCRRGPVPRSVAV